MKEMLEASHILKAESGDVRVGRASGTCEWDVRVGRACGTCVWDVRVGRASSISSAYQLLF